MRRKRSPLHLTFFIVVAATILADLTLVPTKAQTPTPSPSPSATEPLPGGEGVWSAPINLSHSGAAADPRILAAQDGRLQVFWIDQFDGMTTALYNREAWSFPIQTTRPTSIFLAKPQKIMVMPFLFTDSSDRVHAFWYGEKDPETDETPLFYNTVAIGSTGWTAGNQVAESARIFDAIPISGGDLELAYVRTLRTEKTFPQPVSIPPGVYTRRTSSAAKLWDPATTIEASTYYRVLPAEDAFIRLVASGNAIFMIWLEPRLSQTLYSVSTDGGTNWSSPAPLGQPGEAVKEPQLAILPNGDLLHIWQDGTQSSCVLYQQELPISASQPSGASGTPTPRFRLTPTPALQFGGWGEPHQILPGMDVCPSNSRFVTHNGVLYWLWGEDTTAINLSAWDPEKSEWTLPQTLSFSFEDPETGRPVQLDKLHAVLTGDRIAITGADTVAGEVWATMSKLSAFDFAFAPPSPWSRPRSISGAEQTASQPAVAIDFEGRAHVVWSQGKGEPGTSLYYARVDEMTAPQPVEIVKGAGREIVRQPFLLAGAKDQLHLAWSGGTDGEIYYSRALADQAGSVSGWLPPIQVSEAGAANWPQIAVSHSGRIFILYARPVNEGRGIYLVFSDNGGDAWSAPSLVFDGQAAGWESVDHPALAVAADGSLHAAWSRVNIASADATEGVFYSRTQAAFQPPVQTDGATPAASPAKLEPDPQWIKTLEVAPAGSDWPRLAAIGNQMHLLYFDGEAPSHRWLDLAQQTAEGVGWGTPVRLPGWQAAGEDAQNAGQGEAPPFALASDNDTLRAAAPVPGSTNLQLSQWINPQNGAGGRWNEPEVFTPVGLWSNLGVVSAMSPETGGKLAIAWLARPLIIATATPQPALPGVYLTIREIPAAEAFVPPASTATPRPTQAPESSPTPVPTATPPLNLKTEGRSLPIPPLVLGGGLAAIIVVAIFIGILVQSQSR